MEQAVEALAAQRGEVIVSSGAAAANSLGLTTQVPVRTVYLTSGRTRKMSLGKQIVELRHAPRWQLAKGWSPRKGYSQAHCKLSEICTYF